MPHVGLYIKVKAMHWRLRPMPKRIFINSQMVLFSSLSFSGCLSSDQLDDYKLCWQACRNSIADTNVLYQAVAKCYEEICYMNEWRLYGLGSLVMVLIAVIFFWKVWQEIERSLMILWPFQVFYEQFIRIVK